MSRDLLHGIRVISLEQSVAAPICTRQMADLGADVIKLERPEGGDLSRGYDDFVGGFASHFVWTNRGKRSLAIDLKSEGGKAILSRLLESADVFVSNLAPAAVERLVDDASLARSFPWLIRCYVSGYAADGPYRDRRAFDLLVQGEAGVTRATGTPDTPAKCGVSLADLASGIYAFGAICAALTARGPTRNGNGRRIDVSMFDVMTEWMMPLILARQFGDREPQPAGLHHASIVPYGAFPTADGELLNVAVHTDRQWIALCSVLGLEDMGRDPRYASNIQRLAARDAVDGAVADKTSRWRSDDLVQALDAVGIPWGRLSSIAQLCQHPELTSSKRWQMVSLPDGSRVRVLGDPIRIDGAYGDGGHVPKLGEHTVGVLAEIGIEPAQVGELANPGIVRPIDGS